MKYINGFDEIMDTYDTFILDQWGVLHNGADSFEHAVEVLEELSTQDKKVVILSNSGKTSEFSYQRLEDSGISRDLYIDVLTSGDHMRHNFNSGLYTHLGTKALFFPWDNDYSVLDDCGVVETDVNTADFILCVGLDRGTLEAYETDLYKALERKLPLVVSNPDLLALSPDGYLRTCPGAIAKAYEDMGGVVYWHGKPQPKIYDMCKDLVGGWDSAVAVGDSLEHDIVGANNAGISSVFIRTGIHYDELKSGAKQEDLNESFGATPTYICDWFAL